MFSLKCQHCQGEEFILRQDRKGNTQIECINFEDHDFQLNRQELKSSKSSYFENFPGGKTT